MSAGGVHLLLPLLFPLVLCVLQHLLLPQVKEVRRIGVEFKRFLVVVSTGTGSQQVQNVDMCLNSHTVLHSRSYNHIKANSEKNKTKMEILSCYNGTSHTFIKILNAPEEIETQSNH